MEELMVKIEDVSKLYKLGQIGGTTLRDELQRRRAKLRGEEDPTKRIGAKDYNKGETFMALNGVSFEVKKGERVGIIGHNGAGKSTLLKLISRITAPTEGTIYLNGRVASMLEVGTGFHPELTGRENIYMNGAILGMTKKEIDAKMEDIIEFSECRQFIDTPVKRYSSGMYVKLAFSVAAHLDSEILIMDEVLAVGDMAFQKKCLDKMNDVSHSEGRTILYVSHNMNTIRQLCDRVVVLDHGKVVFDGEVESGIEIYTNSADYYSDVDIDLSDKRMEHLPVPYRAKMTRIQLNDKIAPTYIVDEKIAFSITIKSFCAIFNLCLRLEVRTREGNFIGTAMIHNFGSIKQDEVKTFDFDVAFDGLINGSYCVLAVLYNANEHGRYEDLDAVDPTFCFEIRDIENAQKLVWNYNRWGRICFRDIRVLK